jgi:hypothetical protein
MIDALLLGPICEIENLSEIFLKADNQGENSFAKSRVSRDWTLFQKTPVRCGYPDLNELFA